MEPYLRAVYRILAEDEDSQDEPTKLLEVNDATVSTGSVEAFGFSPTDEIPFKTVVAEPADADLARRGRWRTYDRGVIRARETRDRDTVWTHLSHEQDAEMDSGGDCRL